MMSSLAALTLLVAAIPAIAQHATGKTLVNDPDHIARLNNVTGSTWTAGHNDYFNGMTFDDARVLMGTSLAHISEHLDECLHDSVYKAVGDDTVPAEFDARTQWPGLIHPIRNQDKCGSCWAFSASEVLSDRVAIATKRASPVLSPEDMVSCDTSDNGCGGGQLPAAWNYLKNTGIVTDSCLPYTAGNGTAPACASTCADSESFTRTKAKNSYAINGALNMQKEIMTNGPIQVAFLVYNSFMSYKTGVYKKHWWEFLPAGGHAVKVVGWGTETTKSWGPWGKEVKADYWLVANSWTTTWGLDGFFKISRGDDQCGMESMGPPYAGMPAVDSNTVVV